MTVHDVLTLIGGLAMFLFGMNTMSSGLSGISGGRLKSSLKRLASSRLRSILLGIAITAVIQSSSAVTVMLVGLVNSGIMTLKQSIGVIMGSNIGTTVTAWILSLAGIRNDNAIVSLLKPESLSPVVAVVGIALIMLSKDSRKKKIGNIMAGFAILMFGMDMMGGALKPLSENEAFLSFLILFSNPFLGVMAGAVFTGIIQSSSASVGILQALTLTGTVTYAAAIPIIMGQNIGTCVTALISSIGVTKNARRVAIVHIGLNIIGTLVFLCLFYPLNAVLEFPFIHKPADPLGIAVFHSFFNVFSTVILLPFVNELEKLAVLLVRDRAKAIKRQTVRKARTAKNEFIRY
jgi:phosphate:Na+ symporter